MRSTRILSREQGEGPASAERQPARTLHALPSARRSLFSELPAQRVKGTQGKHQNFAFPSLPASPISMYSTSAASTCGLECDVSLFAKVAKAPVITLYVGAVSNIRSSRLSWSSSISVFCTKSVFNRLRDLWPTVHCLPLSFGDSASLEPLSLAPCPSWCPEPSVFLSGARQSRCSSISLGGALICKRERSLTSLS